MKYPLNFVKRFESHTIIIGTIIIIKPDASGTGASGEFEQRRRQKTMI